MSNSNTVQTSITTPTSINDIVFNSDIQKSKITSILSNAKPFPNAGVNGILLHGIWGTGKTTLANMLPDLIETTKGGNDADATFVQCMTGDSNGANLIAKLSRQASTIQVFNHSHTHYFVLDEVDLLTATAMSSLKALMSKPNTIFILTTNELYMIDKGVQNRCTLVDFNAAPDTAWLPLAHKILRQYNVIISDVKLLQIIKLCNGSARKITDNVTSAAIQKLSPPPSSFIIPFKPKPTP